MSLGSLFVAINLLLPAAQDPFTVAPRAYKLQFENDKVRVVRVRYDAREKLASHDHPKLATIYVYLSESGPVRFIHTGHEKFNVIRPAVKAGGFRLGAPVNETHEVESLSDVPTDFLRVELKSVSVERNNFRGRYPPDSHPTSRGSQKVRFDNPQVRISRITCAARSDCPRIPASAPSLLVSITPSIIVVNDADLRLEKGSTQWLEAGDELKIKNAGGSPAELLRIEIKRPRH